MAQLITKATAVSVRMVMGSVSAAICDESVAAAVPGEAAALCLGRRDRSGRPTGRCRRRARRIRPRCPRSRGRCVNVRIRAFALQRLLTATIRPFVSSSQSSCRDTSDRSERRGTPNPVPRSPAVHRPRSRRCRCPWPAAPPRFPSREGGHPLSIRPLETTLERSCSSPRWPKTRWPARTLLLGGRVLQGAARCWIDSVERRCGRRPDTNTVGCERIQPARDRNFNRRLSRRIEREIGV